MRRIVITGAAGLLGQYLTAMLRRDASLLCIDRAGNPFEASDNLRYVRSDLGHFDTVNSIIDNFKPDHIYNCAAYSNVDGCETNRNLADKINVDLIRDLCGIKGSKIIHYSTDYLFNGEDGPYSETDKPDPICYYGLGKLKSECVLQELSDNYLIIRTNVLFGIGKDIAPNFVTWLVDSLRRGDPVQVVTDQLNNPIHAGNLAQASMDAVEKGVTGVLNIAGSEYLSRYDMAFKIADFFRLNRDLIKPVLTADLAQKARRPLKGGLKIDKAKRLLDVKLLDINSALKLMKDY